MTERYDQVKGKRKADIVPKEGPATGPKKQRFEANHLHSKWIKRNCDKKLKSGNLFLNRGYGRAERNYSKKQNRNF